MNDVIIRKMRSVDVEVFVHYMFLYEQRLHPHDTNRLTDCGTDPAAHNFY
jgi:hypothetical protein